MFDDDGSSNELVEKGSSAVGTILAIIYVVSPVDLLPVNPIDDIIVIAIALGCGLASGMDGCIGGIAKIVKIYTDFYIRCYSFVNVWTDVND